MFSEHGTITVDRPISGLKLVGIPLLLSLSAALIEVILSAIASRVFHFNLRNALLNEFALQLLVILPYFALAFAGLGTPQDVQEGARLLAIAAEQGNAIAAYDLAQAYSHKSGLPNDFSKAATLYAIGAAKGFAASQAQLGLLYATGRGVPMNVVRAYMWFSLAAAKGYAPAKGNLSIARSKMSNAEVKEADAAKERCRSSNFKDCD
jgi:hypothetical protein